MPAVAVRTMTKDLYNILSTSRNATKDELKRAYRKKAIENHPDRNKGDKRAEERFKAINEAYSILSDDKKRQIYDQYGYEAIRRGAGSAQGSPFGGRGGGGDFSAFSDLFEEAFSGENIFESFFGGNSNNRQTRNRQRAGGGGGDLQYELEISLSEAFTGAEYDFSINKKVACDSCNGSGALSGSSPSNCRDCGGIGQLRQNKGIFSINTTCPRCRGSGVQIDNPCHSCNGMGIVNAHKQVKVKIPPGINDEQSIRMSGEGHASQRGGTAGDLYLHIRVRGDDYFEREGNDLYCNAHISITQAVLGAALELKNLNDEVIKVTIAAGTQAGSVLRVKGKGMPILQRRGERGELMIRVNMEIPRNVNTRTRELYRELAALKNDNDTIELSKLRAEKKSFWHFR